MMGARVMEGLVLGFTAGLAIFILNMFFSTVRDIDRRVLQHDAKIVELIKDSQALERGVKRKRDRVDRLEDRVRDLEEIDHEHGYVETGR